MAVTVRTYFIVEQGITGIVQWITWFVTGTEWLHKDLSIKKLFWIYRVLIWDEFLRHFRLCDEEDSGLSDEEQKRKRPKNSPKHTRKRIHQAKKNFLEKFKTVSECFRFLACGSKIFFITCHCFSVRSVGYCVITLLFGTFKDITFFQLTDWFEIWRCL